ncbi:chorismate mutase [Streptomyces sp. NPDC002755]|uniref:chorismate mutase n=1 Tax=Streptomyces sp. NPDC002884 TaxID=3154544 RepID=UPI003330B697
MDPVATRDFIAEQRRVVDELDSQLIEIIKARREVSYGIQRHRIEAKRPKSDTSRESAILQKYAKQLDERKGASLAMEVLKVCRIP